MDCFKVEATPREPSRFVLPSCLTLLVPPPSPSAGLWVDKEKAGDNQVASGKGRRGYGSTLREEGVPDMSKILHSFPVDLGKEKIIEM